MTHSTHLGEAEHGRRYVRLLELWEDVVIHEARESGGGLAHLLGVHVPERVVVIGCCCGGEQGCVLLL